jgi:hypothetical protein
MVIVDANAVVDPRAVVIEAFNTLVADTAVPRSLRPDYLTIRAQ